MRNRALIYITYIIFALLSFPFFFIAGTVQDEGYIFKKCWVSFFFKEPIYSDEGCGKNTAVRRKIFDSIYSISQDLPPQYSVEIAGLKFTLHSWFHVGPVPYIVQNFFIIIGDKLDEFFSGEGLMRFYLSKLPVFFFGVFTIFFIQKSVLILGINHSMSFFISSFFVSTFVAFVYNSSIGISVPYMSAIFFISLSLFLLLRLVKEKSFSIIPFVLSSSFSIMSYLPSWAVILSLILGLSSRGRWYMFLKILIFSFSLGFFPYLLSSFDVITNSRTPQPWFFILPRAPLFSFSFISGKSTGVSDRLKDFLNFFGYEGSGQSFIIKEEYGWNFVGLPSVILIMFWIISLFRSIFQMGNNFSSKLALCFFIFFILQIFLFPFPNHPRSFLLFFPPLSVGISLFADEVVKSKNWKFPVFLLFFLHFLCQFYFYYKDLSDLISKGIFHISVRYDLQRKVAQIIKEYGCENFVNLSGYLNFPILSGDDCPVTDYIYLLSLIRLHISKEDNYKNYLENILKYHRGKIFIVRDKEEEKIIDKLALKIGIKITKKYYIPKYILIFTE